MKRRFKIGKWTLVRTEDLPPVLEAGRVAQFREGQFVVRQVSHDLTSKTEAQTTIELQDLPSYTQQRRVWR